VKPELSPAHPQAQRDRWRGMDTDGYERMTTEREDYLAALDRPLLAICRGRVLELGSGTGRFQAKLRHEPNVDQIVGLDLAPQMLRAASAKGLSLLIQADAERLPLASASFDTVVCAFYSLRDMDRAAVYAEVARVLRQGGRFGFTLRSYYVTYISTLWQSFVRQGRWPRCLRTLDGANGVEDDVRDFGADVHALEGAGLRVVQIKTLQFLPFLRRFLPYGYWSGVRATRLGSDIIAVAER
jgi:SAM-dependent methyltransferase